jgi:hypothetical protein
MGQRSSYAFAATGNAQFPMLAPSGGKAPLRAEDSPFSLGSDHEVYQDSSFAIPAVYLNDWPDRYIHTTLDTAANIDPTKLGRVAFIGAATGVALANDPRIGTAGGDARAGARAGAGRRAARAAVFRRNRTRGPLTCLATTGSTTTRSSGVPRPKLLDFEGAHGNGGATMPTRC